MPNSQIRLKELLKEDREFEKLKNINISGLLIQFGEILGIIPDGVHEVMGGSAQSHLHHLRRRHVGLYCEK
ncbi:hypothetical protein CMV_023378 [Castanea mollissima]|uniref:Uncharacterized protein n=1 Tax=Castanea mollissima TaxID=60419 RepID=A0A8J4QC97_9ROSI|nr:hypothetical protein CMV_023378 [Castanea mollissima]